MLRVEFIGLESNASPHMQKFHATAFFDRRLIIGACAFKTRKFLNARNNLTAERPGSPNEPEDIAGRVKVILAAETLQNE